MKPRTLLISSLLLIALIVFYKWKQTSFQGMSEPAIETNASIIEYSKVHNLTGEIFVPKDSAAYETLNKYFSFGQIYVFDSSHNLINCNLESLGGECFQDIADDICNHFSIKRPQLDAKISGTKMYDLILDNSTNISQADTTAHFDYIIVYPWVKYAKACVDENSLKFMCCVKNDAKVRVVLLNLDSQEY